MLTPRPFRLCDGDTFEHLGHSLRAVPGDDTCDAPWDRSEGHGPVSDWTSRTKRPGEVVLASDRSRHRFYDMQEAVATARRDGWGFKGDNGLKPGEKAARAAQKDFEFLYGWCNDQWSYVGVVVELMHEDDDGELVGTGRTDSLWGVESVAEDYLVEVARECADCIIGELCEVESISVLADPVL